MFTVGAFLLLGLLLWQAQRGNEKDRADYDRTAHKDDAVWHLLLHVRQDLKVVVFLLGGIIVLLGVIADRMHS